MHLTETVEAIKKLNAPVCAAVFNLGGGDNKYFMNPFLETPLHAFQNHWETQVYILPIFIFTNNRKAAFIFSQAILPLLISSTNTLHPPSLIFTGATASLKASPKFASFASAKFALRALSQSLAKEFGPQGVHVSHVVADGVFDTPRTRRFGYSPDDGLMDTDEMAEAYWKLHTQGKNA
jgi:NAD(P)-dependent dehydrogenase (short-subunit alcohol dehydrogenase family)